MEYGFRNPKHEISFIYDKKKYTWIGEFLLLPLILNYYEGKFYLVVLDEELTNNNHFRYFVFKDRWIEIKASEFPKEIAIQNIGLNEESNMLFGEEFVNDFSMLLQLDPFYPPFKSSNTAKMWLEIEKDIDYKKSPDIVDSEILLNFKQNYIKNFKLIDAKNSYPQGRKNSIQRRTEELDKLIRFNLFETLLFVSSIVIIEILQKKIKRIKLKGKFIQIKEIKKYFMTLIIISYVYLLFFNWVVVIVLILAH